MAKLLIVEDPCDGPAVVDVLQQAGVVWELLSCSDADRAVSLASEAGVDLVVLDLTATCLDTWSLLERIHTQQSALPIVALAGQGNEHRTLQALSGATTKHVSHASLAHDLCATVAGVLNACDRTRQRIRLQASKVESVHLFSMASDLALVPAILRYTQESVARMGICEAADCMRVAIALEEALLNALYHGNLQLSSELRERDDAEYRALIEERLVTHPFCDRRIHFEARLSPEQAVLVVRDEGQGFDPTAVRDPTIAANLANVSGRGLLLMRSFMDEVRYNEAGNEVTMVKRQVKAMGTTEAVPPQT